MPKSSSSSVVIAVVCQLEFERAVFESQLDQIVFFHFPCNSYAAMLGGYNYFAVPIHSLYGKIMTLVLVVRIQPVARRWKANCMAIL